MTSGVVPGPPDPADFDFEPARSRSALRRANLAVSLAEVDHCFGKKLLQLTFQIHGPHRLEIGGQGPARVPASSREQNTEYHFFCHLRAGGFLIEKSFLFGISLAECRCRLVKLPGCLIEFPQ